jgi:transposase
MTDLRCKRCNEASFVKNGLVRGQQRYRCKICGCNFTNTPAQGKPPAMKALAMLFYAMGNASQGMIAKLLGVSHVAVYKWIRAAGEAAPRPDPRPVERHRPDRQDVALRGGKKTRFGSGELMILWHGEPWPGSWVGVMMRPASGCWSGSGSKVTSS